MAKKKKKKSQRKSDVNATPEALKELLAAKRARKALVVAKALLKQPELDGEYLKLIVEAHALRVRELDCSGQEKEAVEMAVQMLANHPEWKSLLPIDFILKFAPELFSEIFNIANLSEENSIELETFIRQDLSDLRLLSNAACGNYSEEAALILEAWKLVEEGESANGLELIGKIGRRSPFINWRLFVQALAAYYANDDKSMEQNISRIDFESPVNKAVDLLRGFLESRQPEFDSKVWQEAQKGEFCAELRSKLSKIDLALSNECWNVAFNELKILIKVLVKNGRSQLMRDIVAHYLSRLQDLSGSAWNRQFEVIMRMVPDFHLVNYKHDLFNDKASIESKLQAGEYEDEERNLASGLESALMLREAVRVSRKMLAIAPGFKKKEVAREMALTCQNGIKEYPELKEFYEIWDEAETVLESKKHEALKAAHKIWPADVDILTKLTERLLATDHKRGVKTYINKLKKVAGSSEKTLQLLRGWELWQLRSDDSFLSDEDFEKRVAKIPAGSLVYDIAVKLMSWRRAVKDKREKSKAFGDELVEIGMPWLVRLIAKNTVPRFSIKDLPKELGNNLNSDVEGNLLGFAEALAHSDEICRIPDEITGIWLEQAIMSNKVSTEILMKCIRNARKTPQDISIWLHGKLYAITRNLIKRDERSLIESLLFRIFLGRCQVHERGQVGNIISDEGYLRDLLLAAYKVNQKENYLSEEIFGSVAFDMDFPNWKSFLDQINEKNLEKFIKAEKSSVSLQKRDNPDLGIDCPDLGYFDDSWDDDGDWDDETEFDDEFADIIGLAGDKDDPELEELATAFGATRKGQQFFERLEKATNNFERSNSAKSRKVLKGLFDELRKVLGGRLPKSMQMLEMLMEYM